jgi:hypothetical protein
MTNCEINEQLLFCGFHVIYLRTTRIAPIEENALNVEIDDNFQNFCEKFVSGSGVFGPFHKIIGAHSFFTEL